MNKIFAGVSAAILVAAGLTAAGGAQAATLTFSNWLPPSHPITTEMVLPWARAVETESQGRVKVKVLAKPMGKPPAHFDIARDGLADVTLGVHGYRPGRFLLTKAAEMAFLGDSAVDVSVAYWRIYKRHLEKAGEHRGVKVLSIFTHGPGNMFNAKRPITTLSDLEGLKIRVGGGVVNEVAKSLGATALLKPATKSYELRSNGVADGVFFPKESIRSFKLTKLVRHATLVPGGLYNTSFFLVMNPRSFDKLSADDQAAVMRASGEAFARMSGKGWDKADKMGVEAMKADGVQVQTASPALIDQIRRKTASIEAAWIESVKAKGIDGAVVMRDLRAEIKKVQAGN